MLVKETFPVTNEQMACTHLFTSQVFRVDLSSRTVTSWVANASANFILEETVSFFLSRLTDGLLVSFLGGVGSSTPSNFESANGQYCPMKIIKTTDGR